MKKLLAGLLLLTPIIFWGQGRERLKDRSFNPSTFEKFTVELKKSRKEAPMLVHFTKALFIDARPDTSKLGFILAGGNTEYHQLVFPSPASHYFNEKAPEFTGTDSSSHGNIALVIKQLWLREVVLKTKDFGRSMLVGPIDYFSYAYLAADCYAIENDQYRYIGRIDTAVSIRKWMVNVADDLVKNMLKTTLLLGDSLYTAVHPNLPALNEQDLKKKYQADFDLPVLKAAAPTKGVFMSYQEFLDNHPSITDFEVLKDKRTEILRSTGVADSIISNAWGYSDGAELNIHFNEKYYRAIRIQQAYDVLGPRTITQVYNVGDKILSVGIDLIFKGIAGAGMGLLMMGSTNDIMKELVPYQLNIRDGKIY